MITIWQKIPVPGVYCFIDTSYENSGSRMQSCPKAGHTIVIKLHVRVASAYIINMSDDGFTSLKQMIDFGSWN